MPSLVFIHTGLAAFPQHLRHTLGILRRVAPNSNLVLLCNECHTDQMADLPPGCVLIPVECFPRSDESLEFEKRSQLPRDYRDGFWYATSSRFFVLADYMRYFEIENVIHLENDVSLYFDPAEKLNAFRQYADFSVPLDRSRAIAGVVWLSSPHVAERLARHMLSQPDINDMNSLGNFCMNYPNAKPLPTIPRKYAVDHHLDTRRYSEGIELFGGVFDAAAIGQYVGGVHWLNDPNDSRFFINESSDLDLREFDLSWNVTNGVRSLSIGRQGERTDVLAIHAHSKDILGISPFNHGVPKNEADIITGERLQALADLTISVEPVTKFHGRENIKSKNLLEITQHESGAVFVPDQNFISECGKAKLLFIYTHLLPYFKTHVAPRLSAPYSLIVHNSDNGVGLDDLDLLNQPLLIRCWAQHCETAHTRLSPLPSGMANTQWGPTRTNELVSVACSIRKDRLLYANVNPTHPSRAYAMDVVRQLPGATIETGVPFDRFINSLASHKYCLCPRGNGIDSHRFWEALYLDSIPVIVRQDWISAYSEFPVLLLNSWDDLLTIDLQREYIRIKSTAFRFERLSLKYLASLIMESIVTQVEEV